MGADSLAIRLDPTDDERISHRSTTSVDSSALLAISPDRFHLPLRSRRSDGDHRHLDDAHQAIIVALPSADLFPSSRNQSLSARPATVAILNDATTRCLQSHGVERLPIHATLRYCTATRIDHVLDRLTYEWKYVVHEFIFLQLSPNAL